MGKIGTDSYLAKFDKYGDGKDKKKNKKKGGSSSDKKSKDSAKLIKQLKKRVDELENTLAAVNGRTTDAVCKEQSQLADLKLRVDVLEKGQRSLTSQIKSLGKAQKAMKEDIDAVAEEITEAPPEG